MRVLLDDARSVVLRPIEPSDEEKLLGFHETLSEASVRNRFFTPHPLTKQEARCFTRVDGHRRGAVVALDGSRIVGVGRFEPSATTGLAELGLIVADRYQGVGLGKALFREVVRRAARAGYEALVADVLSTNNRMVSLLVHSGLTRSLPSSGGVTTVRLDLDESSGCAT